MATPLCDYFFVVYLDDNGESYLSSNFKILLLHIQYYTPQLKLY